jgi:murein DD-endopeptidase MepM/ murein hydrolase activator NlpD
MSRTSLAISAIALALVLLPESQNTAAQPNIPSQVTDMKRLGLIPKYPADRSCSPLTSLYLSWIDVDGSKREEQHSGVDGGRLRDPILAPAAGVVIAVWEADWGWGSEGALMIRHSKADLGLQDGPNHYYSEFDHLRYEQIRPIAVGQHVKRGEQLATVFRPGGKRQYPPEVHWEVWTIEDDSATKWSENEFEGRYWENATGRLIDPLSMLSLNAPPRTDGRVDIPAFDRGRDYREFRGFTYILPCPKKKSGRGTPRNKRQR